MNRFIKKVTLILLFSFIFTPVMVFANDEQQEFYNFGPSPKTLIDAETGEIYVSINSDVSTNIASVSKLMVHAIVFETLKNQNITLNDEVKISERAYDLSILPGHSNVELRRGETYTVEELLISSIVASANAATVALSEHIAGSEEEFVKLMNEKADELNLNKSKFFNVTGLTNKFYFEHMPTTGNLESENQMSAEDIARLIIYIMNNFPEYMEYFALTNGVVTHGDGTKYEYESTNEFLTSDERLFSENVVGMKTGTSTTAGTNLAVLANVNNIPIIAISLNNPTNEWRYSNVIALMSIINENIFNDRLIIDEGIEIDNVKLAGGWNRSTTLRTSTPYNDTISIDDQDKLEYEIKSNDGEEHVVAPFAANENVARLHIKLPDNSSKKFLSNEYKDNYFIRLESIEEENRAVLPIRMILGALSYVEDLIFLIAQNI